MFEWLSSAFSAIGEFIKVLFSSFWSGVITIIVLICFTIILIALIVSYNKNHKEEIHIVDTSNNLDKELQEQNKAQEKV